MRSYIQKKFVTSLFMVALCILVFSTLLVYQQIHHLIEANTCVIHTHSVIEKINALLLDVVDNDRLENDYITSNNPAYLKTFTETSKDTALQLTQLRQLASDDPLQQSRIDKLEPLINARLAESAKVIQLYQTAGKTAAADLVINHHDEALVENIKLVSQDINNAELALLQKRNAQALEDSHRGSLMVLVMSSLSDILLLVSFILLNKQLAEREVVENKILDTESAMSVIMEGTHDLIAALDLNMNFTAFNNAYETKFQQIFQRKLALGMNLEDALNDAPGRKEIIQAWHRALGGEEFTITQEWGDGNFYEATFNATENSQHKRIGASLIMRDVTQRHLEEQILKEANEKLISGVKELKNSYHEMALLNEMSEVLQSCITSEEAYAPIKTYCQEILPYHEGILYIMHPSRNYLEIATMWGKVNAKERVFAPEQCWALRRNQLHKVDSLDKNIICGHVMSAEKDPMPYICIPLMAHNEALGLLYLEAPFVKEVGTDAQVRKEHNNLVIITAEKQISLALANIKLRETLRHLSVRDPLTGLFNRRYLEETLEREFHRAERKKISLAIIMIDIDHFKRFNDTYGHEAGDFILKHVGKIFQEETRGSDIVCRYGGEEFLIFMYDTNFDNARAFAEKLRNDVRQLNLKYGAVSLGTITISQGIAIFPDDGVMPQTLIEGADHALYKAKKTGRNKIVMVQDELN